MSYKKYKKKLGAWGENLAEKYYQHLGWRTRAKNYRTPFGELDLLLEKNKKFLAVEVKTRSSQSYGWPEEAVDDDKLEKLINSSHYARNVFGTEQTIELEICSIEIKGSKAKISRIEI